MHRTHRPTRRRRLAALTAALLAAAAAGLAAPAVARPVPEPVPDGTSRVWQQGSEVTVGFLFPAPDGSPAVPTSRTADVYLVGPVDPQDAQDPGGTRCPPPGVPAPCLYVPAHDDAFPPQVRGFPTRASTTGFWVVAAPDAPEGAVLTRDVSAPELPPGTAQPFADITELAWAVRVGNRYQPLTSTHWVRWGVARGYLQLDDSVGPGGVAWVLAR